MQAKGINSRLVLDFETTFKQDPATKGGLILPFNSLSLGASQAQNETNTMTGRRDKTEPIIGNVDVSGDAEVPMDVEAIGYWLKALFGAPTTTDNADGTYTHVYKISDTQPSLVVEKGFTDISEYLKYNGVKVGEFSFSFGGDGELTASLNLTGAKETEDTVEYDSSAVQVPLVRFQNFQASVEEGGSPIAIVTQGSVNIEAGLDTGQYAVGSQGERVSIPEGQMNISGSITSFFEDNSLLNKAVNSAESSLKVKFTNGVNILEFFIPELKYERTSPAADGPTGIVLQTPFRAYYNDSAENSSIVVSLTNETASY